MFRAPLDNDVERGALFFGLIRIKEDLGSAD